MTNSVVTTLRRLVGDLDSLGVGWALIGGLAVSARAEPRFTRDIDVCVVTADDSAAEAVALRLRDRGYEAVSMVEQEYVGRLATVRLASPLASGAVVDLLFASSGVEPEIVASAERLEVLPGLDLPVALAGHLVVLKLLAQEAARPQDAADLLALRSVLTPGDEAEARRLAELVV
ncbi:MAG: nucleotidyl transferase AbiEii/AbiGii toxin family protein, partial [Dermatophilaceae bacterium]